MIPTDMYLALVDIIVQGCKYQKPGLVNVNENSMKQVHVLFK